MSEFGPKYTDIVGRRVDFTKGLPLAWGIEIQIPINQDDKDAVREISGIDISDNISSVRFLDLNPQESLPVNLRNIESDYSNHEDSDLYRLALSGSGGNKIRRVNLSYCFYFVFGKNTNVIEKFNSVLPMSIGNEIVIVSGHGWNAPLTIGEQNPWQPSSGKEAKLQKKGNDVSVKKIQERYNDPTTYAAILLSCCYCGDRKIGALDVPLVYPIGELGGSESIKGLLPTELSIPKRLT